MKQIKKLFKSTFPRLYFAGQNTLRNRRYVTAPRRFLIVKHSRFPESYDVLLDWLERNYPEVRALFELRLLPCRVRDWSQYCLHVPWLSDPVQNWSLKAYSQALRLVDECVAHGVPVINRVDRLTNAAKSVAARRLSALGIRTARTEPIRDLEEFRETGYGMNFPLMIRDDWGHGGVILRAENLAELRALPIEQFARPLAVEFIETRSPEDGFYRKYRYLAAGDDGVALHLHISREWITKGANCENDERLFPEEIDYINRPHPHHELFQQARRALEFDWVAFDYAYARDGQLIVWEANPYPYIHFPRRQGKRAYRAPAIERALAAMTNLYLSRAGLPSPQPILDTLAAARSRG